MLSDSLSRDSEDILASTPPKVDSTDKSREEIIGGLIKIQEEETRS